MDLTGNQTIPAMLALARQNLLEQQLQNKMSMEAMKNMMQQQQAMLQAIQPWWL